MDITYAIVKAYVTERNDIIKCQVMSSQYGGS